MLVFSREGSIIIQFVSQIFLFFIWVWLEAELILLHCLIVLVSTLLEVVYII